MNSMRKRGSALHAALRTGHKAFRSLLAACAALVLFSCAPAVVPVKSPDAAPERYATIMSEYSRGDDETLRIPPLDADSERLLSGAGASRDLYIIVHPGYSLFFSVVDEKKRVRYHGVKFAMLEAQFLAEARFISDRAQAGNIVILIIPGDYEKDSDSPRSYVSYLNAVAAGSTSVLRIPSSGSNNGTIPGEDMVNLYHFLEMVKPARVLVGGGYIGRCEREFYGQLTTYYDRTSIFILQEASAVSPDDVTEREASDITAGIQRSDYDPIRRFLRRRVGEDVRTLSIASLPGRQSPPPSPLP